MSEPNRRRGRSRFVYFIIVVPLCVTAVEVAVRIVTPGPRWANPNYVQISSGFEGLDSLILANEATSAPPTFYEGFLYSASPASTAQITFTDYFSARRTPSSVPLSQAENIVWTFGGSTMEERVTIDSLTIANTLARALNAELGPTHVKNFGTASFLSSSELIKFQELLREVPQDELPTIAVFYDGFNDARHGFQYGPGRMQADLSLKLRALVERKYPVLWTYALSQMLSKYFRSWERTGARLVEFKLFPLPTPRPDEESLNATIRVYTSNVRMIEATCVVYRVECFFVLQPLLVTKQPLVGIERDVLDGLIRHPRFGSDGVWFVREYYERVARQLGANERFIDASSVLDGRARPDFYDLGHVAADTPPIIGERIAHMILARL
jgi:hypothetical protein